MKRLNRKRKSPIEREVKRENNKKICSENLAARTLLKLSQCKGKSKREHAAAEALLDLKQTSDQLEEPKDGILVQEPDSKQPSECDEESDEELQIESDPVSPFKECSTQVSTAYVYNSTTTKRHNFS